MNEKLKQADRKIEEREEARESLVNSQKLLSQGNYEGALKENQRVLSLYGQHILGDEALLNMGLIYAHPGNPKRDNGKAMFFFNKLTKEFPQSPFADQARIWLGMLLENQRLNQTVEKLQEVIEESKRVDIEIEERKKRKGIREAMSLGKILLVDDDRNLLELVKIRLESADYEVTGAVREEDALGAN